jgi:diguanylate cyclase (GGDEF)-like protein
MRSGVHDSATVLKGDDEDADVSSVRRRRPRLSLLVRFGLLSLVPIVGLGFFLARDLSQGIRGEAVSDARLIAKLTARLRVQPLLEPSDLRGPLAPDDVRRLTRTLRSELGPDDVTRIKLWNRQGVIVYSDDPSIVGSRFEPSEELEEAFEGEVASEVSTLERAESARDRRFGDQVEVYVPLRFAGGTEPVGAFEIYVPYRSVAARIEEKTRHTFLLLMGGMAVLWATLFPIVAGASRRLRHQATENRHQALHDALTGLPNRTLFRDRAAHALVAARREDRSVGVLIMDVDDFKDVNDTLGHHTGDMLLEQIGRRLVGRLRASDTVARLGGDEFAVLLPGLSGPDEARARALELRAALDEPFALGELRQVHAEASVGVAVYPEHGDDADALIQHADVAMYEAKRARTGAEVYDAGRDRYSPDRLALVGELRRAIARDELVLHYQPKIDLSGPDRTVTGAEALVRWQHPTRGLLPPAEFIPQAEHTGLMRPLTIWVLESALRQSKAWRARGLDLDISVNLSAASLADTALPDDVAALLARFDVPAERLTLEITESMAMSDPMRAGMLLGRLHDLGVGLAIDDFGTGHSSLSYLSRLPVRELKIDRSFVLNIEDGDTDAVIVRSTIDLGHNLGLRVVAEGAENDTVLQWLSARGCDAVQGYAISRPLPAAGFAAWLERRDAEHPPQGWSALAA